MKTQEKTVHLTKSNISFWYDNTKQKPKIFLPLGNMRNYPVLHGCLKKSDYKHYIWWWKTNYIEKDDRAHSQQMCVFSFLLIYQKPCNFHLECTSIKIPWILLIHGHLLLGLCCSSVFWSRPDILKGRNTSF